MRDSSGVSLIEAAVGLAILVIGVMVLAPAAVGFGSTARAAAGARHLAMRLQTLRWDSVAQGRGHGLFFERDEQGWYWTVVRDGNGNGVRTAEVRNGTDPAISPVQRLERFVEGIRPGFPGDGPFPRIPPRRGVIAHLDDPVQFGRSNLIGFSSLGSASSGTLYVTDGRETLFGIVLFGPTARVRVWRYIRQDGRWTL